jgi:hypothetical protein
LNWETCARSNGTAVATADVNNTIEKNMHFIWMPVWYVQTISSGFDGPNRNGGRRRAKEHSAVKREVRYALDCGYYAEFHGLNHCTEVVFEFLCRTQRILDLMLFRP